MVSWQVIMEVVKTGKVTIVSDNILTIQFDYDVQKYLAENDCDRVLLKFLDARVISDEQRKKVFAIMGDISDWCSNDKEYTRAVLTSEFCFYNDIQPFSLSTVDKSTASKFISYLVEFCLKHAIPCKKCLIENCEDIEHYLYNCLVYKRCVVCGRRSEFHHCTGSRTGMGRHGIEIPLIGLQGMALCRIHHNDIHSDAESVFYEKYHVLPTIVDEKIAAKYPHYKAKP